MFKVFHSAYIRNGKDEYVNADMAALLLIRVGGKNGESIDTLARLNNLNK